MPHAALAVDIGRTKVEALESLAAGPPTVAWARSHGWTGRTGEGIASTAALLDLEVAVVAGGFVNVAPGYLDLVHGAGAED